MWRAALAGIAGTHYDRPFLEVYSAPNTHILSVPTLLALKFMRMPMSNHSLDTNLSHYRIDTPVQTSCSASWMAPENEESYMLNGEYMQPHRLCPYLILYQCSAAE